MARRRSDPVGTVIDQGVAELVADTDRPRAWTLLVNGTPQSHVDLDDPTYLDFDYVRRFGHLADVIAAPGGPINALHLGGGAFTLARYIAATRPQSRQRVVEIDGALVDLVRRTLPWPASGIRIRVGDARGVLSALAPATVDLIVVDVFSGARTPAALTSIEFVRECARVLRAGGVLLMNVADGPPLDFARSQVATVAAVFDQVGLVASPNLLRGKVFGNLVLVGSTAPLPLAALSLAVSRDPWPARVLAGQDVEPFTGGAVAVTDATAVPSPAPPAAALRR